MTGPLPEPSHRKLFVMQSSKVENVHEALLYDLLSHACSNPAAYEPRTGRNPGAWQRYNVKLHCVDFVVVGKFVDGELLVKSWTKENIF